MPFSIYTYSNPYEINKELYWDLIKNCPHFCVSQTMANGMMSVYPELTVGKISTVENLVKGLYPYWESMECKIKQYADVDKAINMIELKDENSDKIRQSLKFNRKQLNNSLRILFELNMVIQDMKLELMSEEQQYLIKIYQIIKNSNMLDDYKMKESFTEKEIEQAIKQGMLLEREGTEISNIDTDIIVIHGVHQFSPVILKTIEKISKYKQVILLFNYQQQYKNIYQTWIDVYSAFDKPIKSQFINEFKPNPLLANSYEGNLLADYIGNLVEGKQDNNQFNGPIEMIEFNNNTEFASYIAHVFDNALERQEKDKNTRRSTLYYMKEQFYSANSSVNNLLKVYFPEQFGERHFLSFPIGHFFLSITNMWNPDEGGIKIENMNDIVECLNSGLIKENSPGELSSVFNRTREFFIRAENIEEVISLLEKLKKRIKKSNSNESENKITDRIVYFRVTLNEIDILIDALKQLDKIAKIFYEDFENKETNFKSFYNKIKDFLETRVLDEEDLEEDFRDIVKRVLVRLEEVDNIEATGSFDLLKETMSYYLKQENKKGISANWIVRDFEQIDGDILKSKRQNSNTVYHFACLSDNDMNITRSDRFTWPLDISFFEVAQEPVDWKYQVYIKSRREYKNFKRYALIYGLQFNRVKYKISYVKNIDDKENEMYYLFKILGAKKVLPKDNLEYNTTNDFKYKTIDLESINNYGQYDMFKYRICKYRFLLESTVLKSTVYRDHFLLLKYLEILLENATRISLQNKIATEELIIETLNYEFGKLEKKFEFIKDIHTERMDVITNAKNYLKSSVLKKYGNRFGNITEEDKYYMEKREEFIYLKLGNDNKYSLNFRKVLQSEVEFKLSKEYLDKNRYKKSCGPWCQYCSIREICLEPYKYDKKEIENWRG